MQKQFNIRTLSGMYLAVRPQDLYGIPSFRELPTKGCMTWPTEEGALQFYKRLLVVIIAERKHNEVDDIIYDIENIPFEVYSFYQPC